MKIGFIVPLLGRFRVEWIDVLSGEILSIKWPFETANAAATYIFTESDCFADKQPIHQTNR